MRQLSLGQPIGETDESFRSWVREALREIELASHEESGEGSSAVSGSAGAATPLMDSGTGAVGTSAKWAHEDHVHPMDTSLAPLDSPPFTGTPTAPTAAPGTATTQLATTEFVAAATPAPAFDSGTRMLFQNSTAPTGWTKDTTHNDKAIRIVSGTVGAGGSNAFSTVMAQTTVGNTTLSTSQVPNLSVSVSGTVTVYPAGSGGWYAPISSSSWNGLEIGSGASIGPHPANDTVTYTNAWSGGNSMSGGTTNGGGGAHNHSITMNIAYVDFIIATKN